MKRLIPILLVFSILINFLLSREIIKYEPNQYKYRLYNSLKQEGWFDHGTKIESLKADSIAYILTLGQSNAGNSSNSLDTAGSSVYSYYNGKLYQAADPLIGSNGIGGSVWPAIADRLISTGLYKHVVLIPIAVGNTNIDNWAHGKCSEKLKETLRDLKSRNIKLTHILWHQGESNNGTSKVDYKKNLSSILKTIRSNGQNAPFYCSIASYTPTALNKPKGIDINIQAAQREFINENEGVLLGPNTDTILDAIDRYDSQHFSKVGKAKYVNLWMQSLIESSEGE
jgi:hypothetical protein